VNKNTENTEPTIIDLRVYNKLEISLRDFPARED
jgi:hypothetical protein